MLAKSVRMPHTLLGTALIEMCFSNAFIGTAYTQLAHSIRCAPTARSTSGGRFHPESCRLIW
jgi:hypothetical protein